MLLPRLSQTQWNKASTQSRVFATKSHHVFLQTGELQHLKTTQMACVDSEDSDQPVHPCSLISLRSPHEEALGPWLPTECQAKSLIRLRSLIGTAQSDWSLRGHICHFVDFVMLQLR